MYLFTVKFCCKDARPGYHLVKADNCYEAIQKFFQQWTAKDFDIPVSALLWFKIERWCLATETTGMEE